MSSSTFPVEVMNEIFRSSELDHSTLANCCLLSKRYLDTARKWLYFQIDVIFVEVAGGQPEEEDVVADEYAATTGRLLHSLLGNASLRELVRSIAFVSTNGDDTSGVRLHRQDAVPTFLSLAPNADRLSFSKDEDWYDEALASLTSHRLRHIRGLEVPDRIQFDARSTGISFRLENLEDLTYNPENFQAGAYHTFTKLKSVCCTHWRIGSDDSCFSSSAPTLRKLGVPLHALPDIQLHQYPRLDVLSINQILPETLDLRLGDELPFWKSFKESKFRTLMIAGRRMSSPLEEEVFAPHRGLLKYAPDSLKRIELWGKVSLDRLRIMLKWGKLTELGIDDDMDESDVELIRFMCESAGVELFHIPALSW
ncbi:hypothetical protein JCM11491_005240 [Sporobolomyces phaffii]